MGDGKMIAQCTHMTNCDEHWLPHHADLRDTREAYGVQQLGERPKPERKSTQASIAEMKLLMKDFLEDMKWMNDGVKAMGSKIPWPPGPNDLPVVVQAISSGLGTSGASVTPPTNGVWSATSPGSCDASVASPLTLMQHQSTN